LPATALLRTLVVTEIVLLAASVLTLFLPVETPPAVDEYLEGPGAGPLAQLADADPSAGAYVLGALLVVFVAIYVASLIGLLCLTSWSRRLYVISFVVGACIYPFLGSSLVDPISGTVDYLAAACSGAILATLFSSDVKAVFGDRTPATSLERTRGE
jgi:hypothetical protein